MNRKSHKAKRDEKQQSEKHVHFWPMRIISLSAKVNKQQDPTSDCFHLMGGAGWEMVFLRCWSTFSFPWKKQNCVSVKGWNASQTVCALFLQNVCEERNSPQPRVAALQISSLAQQVSTGLWPQWAPWPVGQEFPGTFPLQLILPLPIPSACAPHSRLSCLTYS